MSDWSAILSAYDIENLQVTSVHALRAGLLTLGNADPFDRIIVAQSQIEQLIAVSNASDRDGFGVLRLWDRTI